MKIVTDGDLEKAAQAWIHANRFEMKDVKHNDDVTRRLFNLLIRVRDAVLGESSI